MKKSFIKYSALFIGLMGLNTINAQDFHLSQYDNSLQQINPAYTGFGIDKDYRVNINQRSQWKQITSKSYRSFLFSYDQPIDEQFSAGGYFISNNSGENNINTFNAVLSGAYNIIQSPISEHKLTAGLQLGVFHRSVNYQDYIFDAQYDGSTGGFDQSISSGETFERNAFTRFDAGIGMYYHYKDEDIMFNPFGGISLQHIGFPNESISIDRYTLPLHLITHLGTDIQFTDEFKLTPNFLFMYQKKAHEVNFGVMGEYNIKDTDYSFMLGLNHRWADAIITHAGFKYKNNILRVSYDYTTSYLKRYNYGRGGLEFSLVFIGSFDETVKLFKPSL